MFCECNADRLKLTSGTELHRNTEIFVRRSRRAHSACVRIAWLTCNVGTLVEWLPTALNSERAEVMGIGAGGGGTTRPLICQNSRIICQSQFTRQHSCVRGHFSGSGSIQQLWRARFVREAERFFSETGRPSCVREKLERPRSTDD